HALSLPARRTHGARTASLWTRLSRAALVREWLVSAAQGPAQFPAGSPVGSDIAAAAVHAARAFRCSAASEKYDGKSVASLPRVRLAKGNGSVHRAGMAAAGGSESAADGRRIAHEQRDG